MQRFKTLRDAALAILTLTLCCPIVSLHAQESAATTTEASSASTEAEPAESAAQEVDYDAVRRKAEAEKAQAEAERAKAEAAKAKADAEKARIEADQAKKTDNVAPSPRRAAPTPFVTPPENVHHHDGLFARIGLGLGGAGMSAASPDKPLTGRETMVIGEGWSQCNFAAGVSLDVGGSIAENLILHFRFSFANDRLDSSLDDDYVYYYDDDDEGYELQTFVLGAGMTYYFMPVNVYLTLIVGMAFQRYDYLSRVEMNQYYYTDISDRSATGVTVALGVGKEWWVSDNWAVGGGLEFSYAYAADDAVSINRVAGGIVISFTYD